MVLFTSREGGVYCQIEKGGVSIAKSGAADAMHGCGFLGMLCICKLVTCVCVCLCVCLCKTPAADALLAFGSQELISLFSYS